MSLTIAIIGAIVAIFSIIILHELGHFFVARFCGIKILRFSVGFGKPLWKRTSKSGTEYVLAILPLGGYVKMLGEGEETTSPEDAHRAFNQKPLLSRMAVVAAGPVTNFLLAIIAYWGVYLIGVTHTKPVIGAVIPHSIAAKAGVQPGDELRRIGNVKVTNWQRAMMTIITRMGDRGRMVVTVKPAKGGELKQRVLNLAAWHIDHRNPEFFRSLGILPYQPVILPIVGRIMKDSPAGQSGLQLNDRIIAINGKRFKAWMPVVEFIRKHPQQKLTLTVLRGQKQHRISVITGAHTKNGQAEGYLGVMAKAPIWPAHYLQKSDYSLFSAWVPATEQAWHLIKFNFIVLVKMITGKISVHTLGGPITVFQAAGKATQAGWQVYLGFIGFISLTIGFINLLPIPGLDGGHLLFQIIEGIFRRPVPERAQMIGLSIGMIFLVLLMVQATINDLIRLFL